MSDYYTIPGHYTGKDYLVEVWTSSTRNALTVRRPEHWDPPYKSLGLRYATGTGKDIKSSSLWLAHLRARLHVWRTENALRHEDRGIERKRNFARQRGGRP